MTNLNFAVPLEVPVELQRDRILTARAEWRRGSKNCGLRREVREMFDELDRRGAAQEGPSTVWIEEDELAFRQRDPAMRVVLAAVESELAGQVEGMIAVADSQSCVLFATGSASACRKAESIGLWRSVVWSVTTVGSNALGAVVRFRRPVQLLAEEHYRKEQADLVCSAYPVFHDGRLIAVLNVTDNWRTAQRQTMVALRGVAEKIQLELARKDRYRRAHACQAGRALELCGGPALVLDKDWMVVAGYGMPAAPGDQLELPGGLTAGVVGHRMLGTVLLEPLPPGKCWLLREVSPGHRPTLRVILDFADPDRKYVRVRGTVVPWDHRITKRQAEILTVLHHTRSGCGATALSRYLHDAPGHEENVRSLMCRIRGEAWGLLESEPYRFGDQLTVELR